MTFFTHYCPCIRKWVDSVGGASFKIIIHYEMCKTSKRGNVKKGYQIEQGDQTPLSNICWFCTWDIQKTRHLLPPPPLPFLLDPPLFLLKKKSNLSFWLLFGDHTLLNKGEFSTMRHHWGNYQLLENYCYYSINCY